MGSMRRSLGRMALALAAAAMLAGPAARAEGGFAAADPATRLGMLNWQQVLLERMSSSACFAAAGTNPEAVSTRGATARARFDATLADLRAGLGATIPDERTKKQVERGLDDLTAQWWRFRGALDTVTSGRDATAAAMAAIHAIDRGMSETLEKLYTGTRRALTKAGQIDMGASLGEYAAFRHVALAETAVSRACLASLGALPDAVKAEAEAEIAAFAADLAQAEASPFAPPAQKALIPAWRAMLPKLTAAAAGTRLGEADLGPLMRLLDDWAAASDRLGLEPKAEKAS